MSPTLQAEGTQVYLARQPIFDGSRAVFGYELLYRSGANGGYDGSDGAVATIQVLSSSILGFGLDRLLKGKPGFVNFPRDLLVADFTCMLPADSIVIEVLETVEPDEMVVGSCRKLRNLGYQLALDDIGPDTRSLALAEFASIIKVDYRATTAAQRGKLLSRYGRPGVRMLAEKVETQEEFTQAKREGFHLFQGYFFTRPVILSRTEIPAFKLNYLRLLTEIHNPDLEFWQIERLIKQEASLCDRLLRYANSAVFARRNYVATIREAMVLLGEDELRRWASLAALPAFASDKPGDLLESALLRARFCELIAPCAGLSARRQEIFLMGMFSLLDAMIGRPMEELLEELHLPGDIANVLLGRQAADDGLAPIYKLALAVEKADWDEVARLAAMLGLPEEANSVSNIYLEAVQWCQEIFRSAQ